jgi:ketosteroid isomerase-like protein
MYNGKVGVGRFFSALADNVSYKLFDPREYFADGNNVFVKGRHEGTAKSTGKSFAHDFMMQFTLTGGKVCYYFVWVDTYDQAKAYLN